MLIDHCCLNYPPPFTKIILQGRSSSISPGAEHRNVNRSLLPKLPSPHFPKSFYRGVHLLFLLQVQSTGMLIDHRCLNYPPPFTKIILQGRSSSISSSGAEHRNVNRSLLPESPSPLSLFRVNGEGAVTSYMAKSFYAVIKNGTGKVNIPVS